MDELGRTKSFIQVVEAGSFSGAARGMSVSAVTRRIQSLEDEIGVRLMHRNTRGISLTDAGQNFYERIRGVVAELDDVFGEAKSLQTDVKGTLRVSLRHSAAKVITPALDNFITLYPDLKIDLIVTDERLDLMSNNIDVAVWLGPLREAVIVRKLCPSQRVVCAAPAYFEKYGKPKTPIELKRHNCLHYTPIHANRWTFTRDCVVEDVEINGSMSSDHGPSLLSAAISGIGVAVVFEWMVRDLIENGQLVSVLSEYSVNPHPGDADLYAVWPSSRGMARKVRVFVDFLVDFFSSREPKAPITEPFNRP